MAKRFENLTKAQDELFGRIATGDDSCVNERTVAVLIERELVERYYQVDGAFTWHRYRVPVAVHIHWCEWCDGKEV